MPKNFGVQVIYGVIGRVINAAVAFLGSILLARILGPAGYGSFYFLLALVHVLDNPAAGWINACRKRMREVDFPGDEALGASLIAGFGFGITVLLPAYAFNSRLQEYTELKDPWIYFSILLVTVLLYTIARQFMQVTEEFGFTEWFHIGRDISRVVLQSAFVLLGLGVAGMVGGMVLANLLIAPVIIYMIGIRPALPSWESLKEIWSFARASIPSRIVGSGLDRMDLLLLGFVIGSGAVGNYQVAMQLTLPAMFLKGVMVGGLIGQVSELQSRGEDITRKIVNNASYVSIISVPLFFGALAIGDLAVVTVYSNQYKTAGMFVAGLALFRVFRTQSGIYIATLDGMNRPDLNLKIWTAVFIVNLALGIFLLFKIGPIGVVYATVFGGFLGWGVRVFVLKKMLDIPVFPRALQHQVLSGVVMAVTVYALRQGLELNTLLVFGVITIGVLVYFVVLIIISRELRLTVIAVSEDFQNSNPLTE